MSLKRTRTEHPADFILARVRQHAGFAASHEVAPDTTFAKLGLDSLDVTELTLELEDDFEIDVSDGEIGELATVGDLIALIKRKLDAKAKESA